MCSDFYVAINVVTQQPNLRLTLPFFCQCLLLTIAGQGFILLDTVQIKSGLHKCPPPCPAGEQGVEQGVKKGLKKCQL